MIRILLCLLVILPLSTAAFSTPLLTTDFESATVGSMPPQWSFATTVSGISASVANGYAGNTTHVLGFHDNNANTSNNTIFTSFTAMNRGVCTFQFDVCLSTIHAGFGVRITNGAVPTSGQNWATAIKFEGDVPYAPGGAAGTISYQVDTTNYAPTSPAAIYQAGIWYTVKMVADLDSKLYYLYFGPSGETLPLITPSAGIPFIKTTSGGQVTSLGGITIYSSTKTEPAGDIYIDNINISSNIEQANSIVDLKRLPQGTGVVLNNMIATAGTDQTTGPFFYIGDRTGGIRVRSGAPVRQGDMVNLYGTLQRASDDGTTVLRNGEREINAKSITITYGPYPMPRPIGMINRAIGGGPSSAMDSDGYPCQPGVWARSTGDTSGYDQVNEAGLNNVGLLGRFWGKVVYADNANHFFYINDGSGVQDGAALADGTPSPNGIRVLVPSGIPLNGIVGKFATITGIVGSVAQSNAGSPVGPGGNYIRNIRVIRPTCEPFLDLNLNGFYDPGEPFIDTNSDGSCNGISIEGVPGPNVHSGFDRYGTLIMNGAPFLIKGVYNYSIDNPTLDEMVRQGFNTVSCFDMSPGDLPTIDAHNMKTLPCLRDADKRPGWMAVKDDPAILGWYVYDEPEGFSISPQVVGDAYNWVKQQDPTHVAGNSHFLIDSYATYKNCEEFSLSDCYPMGTSGTSSIVPMADFLATIHGVHGSNYYPAWQWVQTFQSAPTQGLPTPDQERAMVYLALAYQAKAYLFFSYQHPDNPMWPSLWAEVKQLNSELDMFRPFLLLPWTPVDAISSDWTIRIGGFRVGGSALIAVVNTSASTVTSTLTLPGIPASSLTLPLEGGATVPLTNRSFTMTLNPYQTRVLLWGSIPSLP